METKFNSQICTTREQWLLALGLKRETADMIYDCLGIYKEEKLYRQIPTLCDAVSIYDIPAWSLHRLIEMIQEVCPQVVIIFHRVDIRSNVKRIAYSFDVCDNLYDNIVDCIEWLIKEVYFNEAYLV